MDFIRDTNEGDARHSIIRQNWRQKEESGEFVPLNSGRIMKMYFPFRFFVRDVLLGSRVHPTENPGKKIILFSFQWPRGFYIFFLISQSLWHCGGAGAFLWWRILCGNGITDYMCSELESYLASFHFRRARAISTYLTLIQCPNGENEKKWEKYRNGRGERSSHTEGGECVVSPRIFGISSRNWMKIFAALEWTCYVETDYSSMYWEGPVFSSSKPRTRMYFNLNLISRSYSDFNWNKWMHLPRTHHRFFLLRNRILSPNAPTESVSRASGISNKWKNEMNGTDKQTVGAWVNKIYYFTIFHFSWRYEKVPRWHHLTLVWHDTRTV